MAAVCICEMILGAKRVGGVLCWGRDGVEGDAGVGNGWVDDYRRDIVSISRRMIDIYTGVV